MCLNFMEYLRENFMTDATVHVYFALYHDTYLTLYHYFKINSDYYLVWNEVIKIIIVVENIIDRMKHYWSH
jgi:hypothetical protein